MTVLKKLSRERMLICLLKQSCLFERMTSQIEMQKFLQKTLYYHLVSQRLT